MDNNNNSEQTDNNGKFVPINVSEFAEKSNNSESLSEKQNNFVLMNGNSFSQANQLNYIGGGSLSKKSSNRNKAYDLGRKRGEKVYGRKATLTFVAKHIGYFAMMILLNFAKSSAGLSPFSLGLFVGLVYCRENVFALSLSYILSGIIVGFSVPRLIIAMLPPIIFIAARLLHNLFLRPMKMLQTNLYALLSQLPVILFNISSTGQIVHAVCCIVIAQIFTYTATIGLYAIIIRGAKYRLAKDELFGLCTLVVALCIGLFSINVFSFKPFYLFSSFILMMLVFSKKSAVSFIGALVLGLGAGLEGGNLMIVGGLVLCVAVALLFSASNIYFGTAAFLIGDVFVGLYFNAFGKYDYLHVLAVAIGLIGFLIIPKNVKEHFIHLFGGGESQSAEHSVVLRNRQETSRKLGNMAKVLSEIGGVLGGAELVVSASNSLELAGLIAVEHCSKCPNYKFCSAMLGGDTTLAIKDIVDKAIYNGVITKDDLSPFLQSRCTRQDSLINLVSDKSQRFVKILDRKNQIGAGRIILGEQMQSLSAMLMSLGQEIRSAVFFDSESEQNIITELYYYNIVCRDIVVSGENGVYGVTLTVRHKDSSKSALPNVVSKVLKCVFEVVECLPSKISGFDIVELKQSPKYAISYGVATCAMDGSRASGDTFSVQNVAYDKTMLVLCDGMGSGEKANFNSTSTIGMIENFYKAGFNNNAILSLINKILATYNSESFTCLDMAMVDLTAGVIDIIKLGGTQSMIIRNHKCYLIGGGALPLGIVEEAKPYTDRHIIMDGDIMVMATDGISDYLKQESICDMIINNPNASPEQLAEDILRAATAGGAKDDSTVIVTKIYDKK